MLKTNKTTAIILPESQPMCKRETETLVKINNEQRTANDELPTFKQLRVQLQTTARLASTQNEQHTFYFRAEYVSLAAHSHI